jgi:hypothetical protein
MWRIRLTLISLSLTESSFKLFDLTKTILDPPLLELNFLFIHFLITLQRFICSFNCLKLSLKHLGLAFGILKLSSQSFNFSTQSSCFISGSNYWYIIDSIKNALVVLIRFRYLTFCHYKYYNKFGNVREILYFHHIYIKILLLSWLFSQ